MRYPSLAIISLTLFGAACGGGEPSGPQQSGGPPAAIVVVSGDAQQAAPSAAVASVVSVKVTDATGAAVGGVTVTFRVDSGGGRIAKSSATTSSAGIASPGAWTLGSSEGRNVLVATVGDLPPLRIRAEAVLGAGSIPGQTIGAGGGTLEITTPGNPYQGLRLTVPSGAYATAGTWNITLATNPPTPTLPDGFTVAGPALLMQTTQRRANRLMTLRIPVTRVAGTTPLFIMFDPLRNRMEMVPIVASDESSITVAGAHFNASLIAGPSTPGSLRGDASLIGIEGYGYQVNATLTKLGFSPAELEAFAASIWPAPETGSYAYPAGHGPAIPVMGIFGTIQNIPFASTIKTVPTLGTLADTAALAGLEIMAKRHFDATAGVNSVLSDLAAVYAPLSQTNRDELTSLNLRGMLLTSRLPQLMLFPERLSDVPTGRVGRAAFAALLRLTPTTLWFTTPADPSTTAQLTLGSSGFLSRAFKQTVDGPTTTAEAVLPVGGSFLFPLEQYADVPAMVSNALSSVGNLRQTLNNQLAALAGFPTVTLEMQGTTGAGWAPDDSPLVIRDSTAKIRAVCANCTKAKPLYAEPTQQTVATTIGPCADGSLPPLGKSCGASVLFDALGLTNVVGSVMASLDVTEFGNQLQNAWRSIVPMNTPLIQRILKIEPATQSLGTGVSGSFSAPVLDPPTRGYAMEWDWGDGTAKTQSQNVSTATHSYAASGKYTVTATLKRSNTAVLPGLTLAVAKAVVTVGFPVWRITSATMVHDVIPLTPGEIFSGWPELVTGFRGDTMFWNQINRGERDGVLVFATQDAPLSVHRGLWMLPDPRTDFATIPAMPQVMLPTAQIGSRTLVSPDPSLNGAYAESGAVPDAGQVTGLSWHGGSSYPGYPGVVKQVTVNFTPTTASGVIDITYRAWGGTTPAIYKSWTARVTFQAVRVR